VAREFSKARTSAPGEWSGPEKGAVRTIIRMQVRAVGAAIAALVQHEHVERRNVT